jgi:dGTP triphosphohydrolase
MTACAYRDKKEVVSDNCAFSLRSLHCFRTRLTHSLEVAQLGRSIARSLQLNEDAVEAIAHHDLGHTPFGHAGGRLGFDCMREYGGF